VRFGELPKEMRKAVSKSANRDVMRSASFDHTHICNKEIEQMLMCFKSNAWDTQPCLPAIESMYGCLEIHKNDPDPKMLARRWQSNLKQQVFEHFVRIRLRK
jgi:hypothetical protein